MHLTPIRPGRGSRRALMLLALLAATLLSVARPAPAAAHASLQSTSPFDGEAVGTAPDQVTLDFNEDVTSATGAIRVYDATGERVDDGQVVQPDADTVGVGVEGELEPGAYVVTWRATSEDGHAIKGAFVFSVGEAAAVDDALLERLFSGDGAAAIEVLAAVARVAGYAGTLLAGGLLLFLLVVRPPDDEVRARLRALAVRGAQVALAATIVGVPLQAMLVSGFGPIAALHPDVLGGVLAGSFGVAAAVRVAALIGVLAATGAPGVGVTAATVATLSFVLDGHTRTVDPAWLLVLGDAAHVLTAGAWFGSVVALALVLRRRRLEDDPVGAATTVARASSIATVSVVVVAVAGSAMSWALVREPRALTSTAYGWTLLVKVALALVVIGLGAYNNRRLVPAVRRAMHPAPAGAATDDPTRDEHLRTTRVDGLATAGWRRLGTTVKAEAYLLLAVLAVTGFLVNQRPAAEAAGITGAYETYVDVTDELELNLVVDPNVTGANEIHVYVLDATGRPAQDLDGVRLRLSLPAEDVGPIEREPFDAGPGHWILAGNELAIPGEWVIEVVVEIDRFSEQAVEVPVVVNPS